MNPLDDQVAMNESRIRSEAQPNKTPEPTPTPELNPVEPPKTATQVLWGVDELRDDSFVTPLGNVPKAALTGFGLSITEMKTKAVQEASAKKKASDNGGIPISLEDFLVLNPSATEEDQLQYQRVAFEYARNKAAEEKLQRNQWQARQERTTSELIGDTNLAVGKGFNALIGGVNTLVTDLPKQAYNALVTTKTFGGSGRPVAIEDNFVDKWVVYINKEHKEGASPTFKATRELYALKTEKLNQEAKVKEAAYKEIFGDNVVGNGAATVLSQAEAATESFNNLISKPVILGDVAVQMATELLVVTLVAVVMQKLKQQISYSVPTVKGSVGHSVVA